MSLSQAVYQVFLVNRLGSHCVHGVVDFDAPFFVPSNRHRGLVLVSFNERRFARDHALRGGENVAFSEAFF